eukprot:CAMPEP_0180702374 /NCGR_PEP_ID=MMETSP1038_2-20121128/6086_1 /TAXON_ID=632150 /ORGANISM="Azadinium spinosum, Strain 3D9" /LENGTH=417 /DNA_ID=CAMNT_0022734131 /DNA_START=1 /DNA_END=1250 /DNA_ORIENTATION=-
MDMNKSWCLLMTAWFLLVPYQVHATTDMASEMVFVQEVLDSADPLCIQDKCESLVETCADDGHCHEIVSCGREALRLFEINQTSDMHDCLEGLILNQMTQPERDVFKCATAMGCAKLREGTEDLIQSFLQTDDVHQAKQHDDASQVVITAQGDSIQTDLAGETKQHGEGRLMRRAVEAHISHHRPEGIVLTENNLTRANSQGTCPGNCAKVWGVCRGYRIVVQCRERPYPMVRECDSGSLCIRDWWSPRCNKCGRKKGSVLCTYFHEFGWLPEKVLLGDVDFLSSLGEPGRICHQGYLLWATHTVSYLASLPDGHPDRSMIFFFVEHWANSMASLSTGSSQGELTLMGLILLAVGMPSCFLLGLMPGLASPFGGFIHALVTHILARFFYNISSWILAMAAVCFLKIAMLKVVQRKEP